MAAESNKWSGLHLFLLSNAVSALLPEKVVMGAAYRPLNFKYMSYWQIRGKSAV